MTPRYDLREAESFELIMTVPGLGDQWPRLARLRDRDEHKDYQQEGRPGDDLWSQARAYARWLSGKLCESIRIYDEAGRYIVTCSGGSDYWKDLAGEIGDRDMTSLHQIGSDGWCWDCLRAGRGFVRHPVTPAEARCEGWLEALPVRHALASHPACDACGGGYMRPAMMAAALTRLALATDGGNTPVNGGDYAIEYVGHGPRCAAVNRGAEHMAAQKAGNFCVGCGGTCCTGNPDDGPCTCTDDSRLAYFDRKRR
jgi:hypothetical protein